MTDERYQVTGDILASAMREDSIEGPESLAILATLPESQAGFPLFQVIVAEERLSMEDAAASGKVFADDCDFDVTILPVAHGGAGEREGKITGEDADRIRSWDAGADLEPYEFTVTWEDEAEGGS